MPRETPADRRARRAAVEDVNEVLDAAARILEARPRSVADVHRRLVRAGYAAPLVEEAVARLLHLGYLDDDAFARAWVASRDRARPRGEHALRRELGLAGVDRAITDAVLGERREDASAGAAGVDSGADPDPDEAAAERLLRRRLSAILREPDPRRRGQRAYGLLARNGFAPDVCSTVARRVLAQAAGDPGNDGDPVTEGDESGP